MMSHFLIEWKIREKEMTDEIQNQEYLEKCIKNKRNIIHAGFMLLFRGFQKSSLENTLFVVSENNFNVRDLLDDKEFNFLVDIFHILLENTLCHYSIHRCGAVESLLQFLDMTKFFDHYAKLSRINYNMRGRKYNMRDFYDDISNKAKRNSNIKIEK